MSYTLILLKQHLKQPGSTAKQVQKLSYTLILIYQQPGSTTTKVQKFRYTLILIYEHLKQPGCTTKKSAGVECTR